MRPSPLPDELASLLENEDGRTLIEMRETEPHFDVTITEATYDGEGTTVTTDGLTTYLKGREVRVGDTVTYWDGNTSLMMGGSRHGWAHNGELVEWKTPFERVAERVQWLAQHDRERRERMERGAEKRANGYASLPALLKARIDRFVDARPDFWLNGDYELFCCTEAAKIADYLKPRVDAGEDVDTLVRVFRDDSDAWKAAGLDDGHSGNTFGGACSLAWALLVGQPV